MASKQGKLIEELIQKEDWGGARKLIEKDLIRDPKNHWLLTHLGVTLYEERRYREALTPLLSSLEIVPDCPLTLWNLAGTLDSLGKSELAVSIFAWLLKCETSPEDDPCWESETWASSLKTDCVYRLGMCFQKLNRSDSAERCFRVYIDLLLEGMKGMYSLEAAASQIRKLDASVPNSRDKRIRAAIDSTLRDVGVQAIRGKQRKLPKLSLPELLAT